MRRSIWPRLVLESGLSPNNVPISANVESWILFPGFPIFDSGFVFDILKAECQIGGEQVFFGRFGAVLSHWVIEVLRHRGMFEVEIEIKLLNLNRHVDVPPCPFLACMVYFFISFFPRRHSTDSEALWAREWMDFWHSIFLEKLNLNEDQDVSHKR